VREGEDSSSSSRYAVIPGSGTFKEIPTKAKTWIGVANVQLVITKLLGELARHIGLQHTEVPLSKNQIFGPDIDQPPKDARG